MPRTSPPAPASDTSARLEHLAAEFKELASNNFSASYIETDPPSNNRWTLRSDPGHPVEHDQIRFAIEQALRAITGQTPPLPVDSWCDLIRETYPHSCRISAPTTALEYEGATHHLMFLTIADLCGYSSLLCRRVALLYQDAPRQPKERPPKARRHRSRRERPPRPLTVKQLEAMQIVGECKGNISQAAKRLGINPKSLRDRYCAASKKLGRRAVKHATEQLRHDRRGQAALSKEDDRR